MYRSHIHILADIAVAKLEAQNRSLLSHIVRAMLAGMYLAAMMVLIYIVGAGVNEGSPGLVKLVMGVCFGGTLSLVLIAGSELFTGSNLVFALAVLVKKSRKRELLANWTWTWVGNWIGAVLLAIIVVRSGVLDAEPYRGFVLERVRGKMNLPAEQLFWRAVLANWLVCLGVWMYYKLESETARILMIWWCMFIFITSGYEHSVANMSALMLGLLLSDASTEGISWAGYWYNLALATLGNVVGGALFVGGLYWIGSPEEKDSGQTHDNHP